MILESGKVYKVRTTSGNTWLFKRIDGDNKTQCSHAYCVNDGWTDVCDNSFVCHDHEVYSLEVANRNYIAMFNHVFNENV